MEGRNHQAGSFQDPTRTSSGKRLERGSREALSLVGSSRYSRSNWSSGHLYFQFANETGDLIGWEVLARCTQAAPTGYLSALARGGLCPQGCAESWACAQNHLPAFTNSTRHPPHEHSWTSCSNVQLSRIQFPTTSFRSADTINNSTLLIQHALSPSTIRRQILTAP